MNDYTIIDGFKCYNPESAISNNGFSVDGFNKLFKSEDNHFWFRGRNRILLFLIKKYSGFKGPYSFLEIGCGNGYVLKALQKHTSFELKGSDIYVQGLINARPRLPEVDLIQLDATKFCQSNSYNAIGLFDVLEHIEEDELVLKNIYTSLIDDGVLYISVPQYMFLWTQLDEIAFHKRRYSRRELCEKVKNAGFKIEYSGSFIFCLFPVMLFSRFLMKIKGQHIKGDEEFSQGNFVNRILQFFILIDEIVIRMGIRLPFGGSLLCVARKVKK